MTTTPDVYTRESITSLLDELSFDYGKTVDAEPEAVNGDGNGHANGNGHHALPVENNGMLKDFTFSVEPLEAKETVTATPAATSAAKRNPAMLAWSEALAMLGGSWQPPVVIETIITTDAVAAAAQIAPEFQAFKPRSFAQMSWSKALNALAGRDYGIEKVMTVPNLADLDPRIRWRNNATRSPGATIAEFNAEMNFQ